MARDRHAKICSQCSSLVQAEDKFCGTCGAEVLPNVQDPAYAQQIAEPSYISEDPPTHPGNRKRLLAITVGALLVLLVGTGAVAYATLGPGLDPLGWSGSQPSDAEENPPAQEEPAQATSPESTSTASVPPDASPDPAFALLLPIVKNRTDAPILLPAKLPNELQNVSVDAGLDGDEYGILFTIVSPDNVLQSFSSVDTIAVLRAMPTSEVEPNRYFESTSTESFQLSDGSQGRLRYMEPVGEGGTYGPYWEGAFDKDGYTYTLSTISDQYGKNIVEQALSTMVLVRGSVGEPTTPSPPQPPKEKTVPKKSKDQSSGTNTSEAKAEEAAGDYYRAAGSQDWDYTYDNLDSSTKSEFTREEWRKKNHTESG